MSSVNALIAAAGKVYLTCSRSIVSSAGGYASSEDNLGIGKI